MERPGEGPRGPPSSAAVPRRSGDDARGPHVTSKVLLAGGCVLTLGARTPNHKQADVLIDGEVIAEVGTRPPRRPRSPAGGLARRCLWRRAPAAPQGGTCSLPAARHGSLCLRTSPVHGFRPTVVPRPRTSGLSSPCPTGATYGFVAAAFDGHGPRTERRLSRVRRERRSLRSPGCRRPGVTDLKRTPGRALVRHFCGQSRPFKITYGWGAGVLSVAGARMPPVLAVGARVRWGRSAVGDRSAASSSSGHPRRRDR